MTVRALSNTITSRAGGRVLVLPLLVLAVLAGPAWGQDTLRLARLTGPIVVDGRVDEPAWEDVPVFPLTMFVPQHRGTLTERTEIRVAYDDAAIYVSGRMYDSDPSGVRANTVYRDAFAGDDLFSIALDTYNDYQTAVWFVVNPAGGRIDQTLSNDGERTNLPPNNLDWNTFWDAEATRDERGWFAEMRIPFSSLGFQDVDGRVVMGLEVYRSIARKNERQLFPDIPPSAGYFIKPSRMQRILLEGVRRHQPVYVSPYGLGGWQRNALVNETATGYDIARDYTHEAGLDVRYSPSPNLSLDITANTDFAQVEADDQQVNLTRFPLFFPEKRQFFQERSAIFDFGLGGFASRLFHSRRIGLVAGQPIRLLGGVRLAARAGGADIGLLTMQTAAALGGPSENFGVARLKQRIFNAYSTVGGMVTTRVGIDGTYNVAAGADAIVRAVGNEYATVAVARTFESGADTGLLDAAHVQLRWERRTEGGLSYAAEAVRSGTAFNPGVGFITRRDYTSLDGQVQYLWYTGPTTPFRTLAVQGQAQGFRRNADGSTESGTLEPTLAAEFKNGSTLDLTYRANYESVRDSFPLAPGVAVLPDDYWFHEAEVGFSAGRTSLFQPRLGATAGQFYDGHRVSLAAGATWNPVPPHLELGTDYTFDVIRFPDRDLALNVHLVRLRVRVAYDAHLSLSTFWQYNSVDDLASVNARLRYNVRDGSDLWIVFNEVVNTDRDSRLPIPPLSQGRAVMVKYTHTLVW